MELGEGENFLSREKKFSPSPKPPSSFKKSEILYRSVVAVRCFFMRRRLV